MNSPTDTPTAEHDAILLRIFLSERSRWGHQPLFEAIVVKARNAGLAGATVLRGPLGYGAGGKIETAKILQLSDNLPVVLEIVESEESIRSFLQSITEMMDGGLATMQPVRAVHFPKQSK